jgi:hypothetical protein
MFKSPPPIIPIFKVITFTSKSEADHKENQPASNKGMTAYAAYP